MTTQTKPERLVEQKVTYTLFKEGQFYIVENVPARSDAHLLPGVGKLSPGCFDTCVKSGL